KEVQLCQWALAEDLENVKQEEQKKYKNKYTPLPDISIPTETIMIPSTYALNKLCKGEYCELYYCTN
ncbi:hypothetical protein PAXINDRAFT_87506, partial [Paxillus involutus ATCC 200175]